MIFIKHTACNTEITLRPVRVEGHDALMREMWCPTCGRMVHEPELDRPGPYCATNVMRGTRAKVVRQEERR